MVQHSTGSFPVLKVRVWLGIDQSMRFSHHAGRFYRLWRQRSLFFWETQDKSSQVGSRTPDLGIRNVSFALGLRTGRPCWPGPPPDGTVGSAEWRGRLRQPLEGEGQEGSQCPMPGGRGRAAWPPAGVRAVVPLWREMRHLPQSEGRQSATVEKVFA